MPYVGMILHMGALKSHIKGGNVLSANFGIQLPAVVQAKQNVSRLYGHQHFYYHLLYNHSYMGNSYHSHSVQSHRLAILSIQAHLIVRLYAATKMHFRI